MSQNVFFERIYYIGAFLKVGEKQAGEQLLAPTMHTRRGVRFLPLPFPGAGL